jgi:hypothetical protein
MSDSSRDLQREANETIQGSAHQLGLPPAEARLRFVCECDDAECDELVRLTADEFDVEQQRNGGIVADGH